MSIPKPFHLTLAFCALGLCRFAAAKDEPFEGKVTATLTRGDQATAIVFTRKGNQLRIEEPEAKLEPVNIIDLEGKKLTIVYPHNTTFVHVDLAKPASNAKQPEIPPLPPPALPSRSNPPTTVGPNISPPPGFPTPPPRPSMPSMPNNPGGGPGSMPMMPPMPMGGPMMSEKAELKKTEQTKKIEGFECALYNAGQRGEQLEIWAINDAALFPFRLIARDFFGRHFGPRMLEETWPDVLQEKSLFPLEVTLKLEPGGMQRLSFKVDKIEKQKIENEKLFQPPEKYLEIQAPQ